MPALLFVCTGNICRSPFAERYARQLASAAGATDWTFASAGIGAMVGWGMDPPMARELSAVGGDPDGFEARALTGPIANSADWIITMSNHHRRELLEEYPGRVRVTMTLGRLAAASRTADPALQGDTLMSEVANDRSRADRAHDVPDPYRRGDEIARDVAQILVGELDAIAPRLFHS